MLVEHNEKHLKNLLGDTGCKPQEEKEQKLEKKKTGTIKKDFVDVTTKIVKSSKSVRIKSAAAKKLTKKPLTAIASKKSAAISKSARVNKTEKAGIKSKAEVVKSPVKV